MLLDQAYNGQPELGYFTEVTAKALFQQDKDQDDRLKEIRRAICGDVPPELGALRMVVRVPLNSTKTYQARFASLPDVLVGSSLAFPAADFEQRRCSFAVLDLARKPALFTIVLQNWSRLELNLSALQGLGCPDGSLRAMLDAGALAGPQKKRWLVSSNGVDLKIAPGDLRRDDVSPRVGRFSLGTMDWERSGKKAAVKVRVEVLALPRLSRSRVVDTGEWAFALGDDDARWRGVLTQTYWRVGAADSLVAMLKLTSGELVRMLDEPVWMSATRDASPLAWMPLTRALERAADAQRRQYIRQRRVARAPTGTLDVSAYLGNLARQRPDRVPVHRFELTQDTPENRLFRGAAQRVRRALGACRDELSIGLRRRLERVEASFEVAAPVEPTRALLERVGSRPLPEVQRRAYELCRAMIEGRYPGLDLQGSTFAEMEGFELDVAELFEAAVRELLARCVRSLDMEVHDGNETARGGREDAQRELHWVDKVGVLEGGRVALLPDLIVRQRGRCVAVGDVKYKRPCLHRGGGNGSFAPMRRGDFHQLMSYFMAWPAARWGVILYPAISDSADEPQRSGATKLLAELKLSQCRRVGVFEVAPDVWSDHGASREELTGWIRRCSK